MTVRADGRIESVETCAAPDGRPGVEFYAGVLVPGLINVHCHLELSYLRGAIAQDGGFAAFARSMGRVRGQFSEQERAAAIAAADARMWAEGMQAVGDVANGDSAFAVKAAAACRTVLSPKSSGCIPTRRTNSGVCSAIPKLR